MKPKVLFSLGAIILLIGLTWLLTLNTNIQWYSDNDLGELAFILSIMLSILMAIGGFIMLIAATDE